MRRWTALLTLAAWSAAYAGIGSEPLPDQPPHHFAGRFKNPNPEFKRPDGWTRWRFFTSRVWASVVSPRTFAVPRVANDGAVLRAGTANPSVTWIGHSTLRLQVDGINVLTDPQWSDRASPVSWTGPRRLAPPGIAFDPERAWVLKIGETRRW